MWKMEFENCHAHTYYSNPLTLPDSPVSIEDYAKAYKERNMRCLILSEHGYRSNVWNQADMAAKYSDDNFKMKAICAAEVYFVPNRLPDSEGKYDGRNFHLLLLAKNNNGFKQLNKILSESQMTGFYKNGRIDFELLQQLDYKNFLCSTACIAGPLRNIENGERYACQLAEIFKENFRLEVQYHNNEKQAAHNAKVLKLYKKYGWPLLFATDSHYINLEDKVLRKELQLASKVDMDDSGWDLYLPTAEQAYRDMLDQGVLSKAQIEEAFENTLETREFEGFSYTTEKKFPISKFRQSMSKEERAKAYQKMVCDGYISKAGMPNKEDAAALRAEMNTVLETESYDYFVGLKDMLDRGVELGGVLTKTARGSAGSFASNFALGFTTLNRLKLPFTMLPQRFSSVDKMRVSCPDIDSNVTNVEAFEQAGKEMFGEYGCLPMIAFGTTKVSSAFKLLARARSIDFEVQNEITKQIQKYELDVKHAIAANSDDPDYDVNEEIKLSDYIDQRYMPLVNESKQYQNIVLNIIPHPCAHLTYSGDLREEIGLIRVKSKTGNKEPKLCACIDGVTADKLNYVKSDLLRVDVVKIINDTFKRAGIETYNADRLLKEIENDQQVWDLYANGITQGLNQCEKESTTAKCMQFKPKNIVELSMFIASIRPGFASMGPTFWSRTPFQYGIPSLDKLLRVNGVTGRIKDSAWLIFDEQILVCLQAGGVPGDVAYATIKYIKKKKRDKVLQVKELFRKGFAEHLIKEEHVTEDVANDTVEKVWRIIEDSASYLFCSAHAAAMSVDSAYCAYLKVHYTYEFYLTMLKLYTEKGDQDKVVKIIDEMKRYKGIKLVPAKFGQDNRDWYVDKTNHTISQSLASLKFISQPVAEDLYACKDMQFESFVDFLRYIQMNTCLDKTNIEVLIKMGYFEQFGNRNKLMDLFKEFREGTKLKCKIEKKTKSWEKRLETLRNYEKQLVVDPCTIEDIVRYEQEYMGICVSTSPTAANNEFLICEVDDKYGVKVMLYSIKRGTRGKLKVKKALYEKMKPESGQIILTKDCKEFPRRSYKNGVSTVIPGEFEWWLRAYDVLNK